MIQIQNLNKKKSKKWENITHTTFVNTSEKNAWRKTNVKKCVL
jgi:hypothetical protein